MSRTVCIEEEIYSRSQNCWDAEPSLDFVCYPRGEWESALEIHEKTGSRVFVIGTTRYPDAFYEDLTGSCLIQRYGVGYGNVPLSLCREKGHSVGYTPGALNDAVAEHAMALILACVRKIIILDGEVRAGNWTKPESVELGGKTLGIIGFGKIGQRLAATAKHGFGMRILAHDIHDTLNREAGGLTDLYTTNIEKAVEASDILSLHLPEMDATRNCFNSRVFQKCRKGAILVNTSRGSVINENDLYDALKSGQLAAAALDVFKTEPYSPSGAYDLRELSNVILTPHCSSNTQEANLRMAKACIRNISAYLQQNHIGMDSFINI